MTYRKYLKTRVIFDLEGMPVDWYTDDVLLCVPKFAWFVARTLLKGYGLRETNYSIANDEGGYYSPDAATFDKIDDSISAFLAEDDMSCDLEAVMNRMADALEEIALAQQLAGSNCNPTCGGSGSSGAGTADPPPNPGGGGGGWYPPGFNNTTEYLEAKCAAANALVAAIKEDMVYLQGVSLVELAASALVITLLTPIPFDEILGIAALAAAFLLAGTLITLAEEIYDFVVAEAEELVCNMYLAEDATEARENTTADFLSNLSGPAYTLGKYWLSFSVFNALFEKNTAWQNSSLSMGVDCNDCDCPEYSVDIYDNESTPQRKECLAESGDFELSPLNLGPVGGCSDRWKQFVMFSEPVSITGISDQVTSSCIDAWRSAPDGVPGDPFSDEYADTDSITWPLEVLRLSIHAEVDMEDLLVSFTFA